MDELTRTGFVQQHQLYQQQQNIELEKIMQAMIDAFLAQQLAARQATGNNNLTPVAPTSPISPGAIQPPTTSSTARALRILMDHNNNYKASNAAAPCPCGSSGSCFFHRESNESREALNIYNNVARAAYLEEYAGAHNKPALVLQQHMSRAGVCLPVDGLRPFCQCNYRRVWLPRDVKSYQVDERCERYFNCMSMTYELRKYYEHRFNALGQPNMFKLNIFIDDKGNLYGLVERNNALPLRGLELKFHLIIRNTDSNEFISHEGLALPATEKQYHFAFRVERPLFDSYFVERKLIRGKLISCSLIVERFTAHFAPYCPSKRYFK
ncbi:uncharacterized protein LOC106636573 isoform X2 [Copidosoma floridanum]|uniref:uncharacterized protein LOC106636573 isoform X2 n=1 Tax=Copidosoma floridanum TaxID=29053 RepID=UPI0006C99B58|nr:uncharacterized protein LOC106636573 isoform X2 [Copidosoma floridanum]